MTDQTECSYCGSLYPGHTMACQSIHKGEGKPMPRQVPVRNRYMDEPAKPSLPMTTDTTKRAEAFVSRVENVVLCASHEAAAIIRALLAELSTERANVKELLSEDCLSDLTRSRMSKILDGVALALKGEPEPMSMHSWHDLAEIAARFASERHGWRPIETAPGDETRILCLSENSYDVAYVSWHDNAGAPVYFNGDIVINPTHWQPLPSPPTGAKS